MKQIKNDPAKYIKRSDLGPKRRFLPANEVTCSNLRRERAYLTAPIDDAGYIDFSKPATHAGFVCNADVTGTLELASQTGEVYYRIDPSDDGSNLFVEMMDKEQAMVAR